LAAAELWLSAKVAVISNPSTEKAVADFDIYGLPSEKLRGNQLSTAGRFFAAAFAPRFPAPG